MSQSRRRFLQQLAATGVAIPTLSGCNSGSGDQTSPDQSDTGTDTSSDASDGNVPPESEPDNTPEPTDSLRFMALGDQGTGGFGQYQVGAAMAAIAREQGSEFVLAAGDNIYEAGTKDPEDPRFLEQFEYPYQNLSIPFYLCLGNHDNGATPLGGGSDNKRGNNQVTYHHSDTRFSNKWRMPERFYRQAFGRTSDGAPFLEIFVVDSNPLTSFYEDHDADFNWENYGYPQQLWMKEAVRDSRAHWKVVMTHVPYRSNGSHGNAGNLDEGLRWLFTSPDADGQRYKDFMEECFADQVDLIISGHDHTLQWLKPAPAMGPAHLIVTGAGGKTDTLDDPERNPSFFQHQEEHGFVWFELSRDTMTLEFHIVDPDEGNRRLDLRRSVTKPLAATARKESVDA